MASFSYFKCQRVSPSQAFIETQLEEFDTMSSPKKTDGGQRPPPIDPDNVQEIAVDEVLNIQIGGGICTIVFGKRRLIDQAHGKPPKVERRVKCRLVLSNAAVDDMMNKLVSLNRAAHQADILATAEKTGPEN